MISIQKSGGGAMASTARQRVSGGRKKTVSFSEDTDGDGDRQRVRENKSAFVKLGGFAGVLLVFFGVLALLLYPYWPQMKELGEKQLTQEWMAKKYAEKIRRFMDDQTEDSEEERRLKDEKLREKMRSPRLEKREFMQNDEQLLNANEEEYEQDKQILQANNEAEDKQKPQERSDPGEDALMEEEEEQVRVVEDKGKRLKRRKDKIAQRREEEQERAAAEKLMMEKKEESERKVKDEMQKKENTVKKSGKAAEKSEKSHQEKKLEAEKESSRAKMRADAPMKVQPGEKQQPLDIKFLSKKDLEKRKPKKVKKSGPLTGDPVKDFRATIQDDVVAKKIFADGRRIPPVELLHMNKVENSTVKIFLFNDFLSEAECDGLMRAHDQHAKEASAREPIICFDDVFALRRRMEEAGIAGHVGDGDFLPGTKCVNKSLSAELQRHMKWSQTTSFYPQESRFTTTFEKRVEEAMGLFPENGGKFDITAFSEGTSHSEQTDCVVGGKDRRDRFATVLVYLNAIEDGGETRWPELGIWVKPRKGRAMVWNNMSQERRPKCDPSSSHSEDVVKKGNKYIMQRWYHHHSSYDLGKRPSEPRLPTRKAGTPKVSCDGNEGSSCRWYDEWNEEHLV